MQPKNLNGRKEGGRPFRRPCATSKWRKEACRPFRQSDPNASWPDWTPPFFRTQAETNARFVARRWHPNWWWADWTSPILDVAYHTRYLTKLPPPTNPNYTPTYHPQIERAPVTSKWRRDEPSIQMRRGLIGGRPFLELRRRQMATVSSPGKSSKFVVG